MSPLGRNYVKATRMFLAYYLQLSEQDRNRKQTPRMLPPTAEDMAANLLNADASASSLASTTNYQISDEALNEAAASLSAAIRLKKNIPLGSAEIVLFVDPHIDAACDRLGASDWNDPNTLTSSEIDLLKSYVKDAKTEAEMASCLTFLMKCSIIRLAENPKDNDERNKLYGLIEGELGRCWDSFETIFMRLAVYRVESFHTIPKFLSRFAHFLRVYFDASERTERNMKHFENVAPLVLSCMIRQAAIVPPHLIGRHYATAKMAKEILTSMSLRFPDSAVLAEQAFRGIYISREYNSSIQVDYTRFQSFGFLLEPRRKWLDDETEKLGPLGASDESKRGLARALDLGQAELLLEVCQGSARNQFGASEEASFTEPGVLHLNYVIHNEVSFGLHLFAFYEGRMASELVCEDYGDVIDSIDSSFSASVYHTRQSLDLWRSHRKALGIDLIPKLAEELNAPFDEIERVYVYPDAHLSSVPWKMLISSIPLRTSRTLPVAVRAGSTKSDTRCRSEKALVSGAWRYGEHLFGLNPRRGHLREGVFDDLPGVKKEVREVSRILSDANWNATSTINCSASEFLAHQVDSKSRRLAHLAAHGVAEPDGRPIIWLPQTPGSETSSSYSALHPERLMRGDWRQCEFVFINACFGGASAPFVGGPPLGFAESFTSSGVGAVLAPLWPVGDEVAYQFACAFYEALVQTRDYFDAFNAAYDLVQESSVEAEYTLAAYTMVIL